MTKVRPTNTRAIPIPAAASQAMVVDPRAEKGAVLAQIEPLPPLEQLEATWHDLERRSEASFFLSWHWMGAWLAESGIQPALLVARRNDLIVGLALIGRDCRRFGPLRLPRIHLNQGGAADIDCVYIEYNDVLVDSTHAETTRAACLAALSEHSAATARFEWPEMHWAASAIPAEHMPGHPKLIVERCRTSPCPYINLDAVREKEGDLSALLSANTRYQIRRAIRLYKDMGELRIERATTRKQGLAWLEELRCLHQTRWKSRGEPGAFARPFFRRFLRRLVDQGLKEEVVDILRVSAGRHKLGYLFNFVYRDRISNYQSGFRIGPDARYKPGLVAHALAVRHYASGDTRLRKYSFLAGAAQYKKSLSTGSEELYWYVYRPASHLIKLKKAIALIATRLSS
jgi:CelD/BcsL family acetyltransferase involved in cellulose biosynthesis